MLPHPYDLSGPTRIVRKERSGQAHGRELRIVVGWSNGGDTAYKTAAGLGRVDVLITLDPVSRLTSGHWLPFVDRAFRKPTGVENWFHAWTTSWGKSHTEAMKARLGNGIQEQERRERQNETAPTNLGNLIAAAGGAWNSQPEADLNLALAGNHGHVAAMLGRVTASPAYLDWLRTASR